MKALRRYLSVLETARMVECYWCGEPTYQGQRHADHIIPLSRGGPHDVFNLCCSCPECNYRKSDGLPEEFDGQHLIHFARLPGDGIKPARMPPPVSEAEIADLCLTKSQDAIFRMRFIKRMTSRQIAAATGNTMGTVKQKINDIRRKVAKYKKDPDSYFIPLRQREPIGPPENELEMVMRVLWENHNTTYEKIRHVARSMWARGIRV